LRECSVSGETFEEVFKREVLENPSARIRLREG
jgi:NADH pyrophosphatase NudC (nudix superfamily)